MAAMGGSQWCFLSLGTKGIFLPCYPQTGGLFSLPVCFSNAVSSETKKDAVMCAPVVSVRR